MKMQPGVLNVPDPLPEGLIVSLEDALEAEFGSRHVTRSPEGLHVADVPTAQAFIATYEGSTVQLAYMQAQALTALDEIFAAKFSSGFSYTGSDGVKRTFQIDAPSQQNIAAQATMALVCASGAASWPQTFYWIDAENGHMPLKSPSEMLAFGAAMGTYVGKLILTNRALKDAIIATAKVAELSAIDLAANWPKAE